LFVLAIVFYVMLRYSNVVVFGIGLTYMFPGIWARAAYGWSRRRRRRPSELAAPDEVAAEPDSLRPL
jgi:CDP-diacylglycerol--serine O-phosphatidyltransferase